MLVAYLHYVFGQNATNYSFVTLFLYRSPNPEHILVKDTLVLVYDTTVNLMCVTYIKLTVVGLYHRVYHCKMRHEVVLPLYRKVIPWWYGLLWYKLRTLTDNIKRQYATGLMYRQSL